ncbi:flavoprotein [Streptomyces fuscigenes]|uniref:flavoprotein n=1 Tax=Streptomyces fuscigenes TaxID=1528880 RepID=UPI001F17CFDB|nr:flavoprotein [Streptomyces fuscigenes]MCF3964903.1 flavoprotein [Streptomyces fuscigenes]
MTSSDAPSAFGGRLLVGASGAAAVALLPVYLTALRTQFTGSITVFMTRTAATFLPPHTVGLFAERVVTGDSPATWPRDNHASLAAEHDLVTVLPTTANMLSAVAGGAAPNLLAATVLQATVPVVFFPVMGAAMWDKAAVRRNVEQVRADGYEVVDPPWGTRYDVSLGTVVEGPMPPAPPQFVETVRSHLDV